MILTQAKAHALTYRREIDGLRAIAVLPVIFFHAGFSTFSGGFIGVDVFFVISGFLITSIILAEKERGKFTLLNFYERRARRILPALFLVTFSCIVAAWFILTPQDLAQFSKSLIAVPVFSSNILFWLESGYFDQANELKPLLHTWSLGVEEQFYFFFPLLVLIVWKFKKNKLLCTLSLTAFISLILSCWGAFTRPEPTFYLLPTRIWELMVGGLVSIFIFQKKVYYQQLTSSHTKNEILAACGLLLIIYGVFAFDQSLPFPGVYALVPTVGTALVILFTSSNTLTGKILGSNILVGLGLISYSSYLWHQPLFAFTRHQIPERINNVLLSLLIVIAIFLAYFSWKYVEKPFRTLRIVRGKTILIFSLSGSIAIIVIGIFGLIFKGFSYRDPPNITWPDLSKKISVIGSVCKQNEINEDSRFNLCYFGDLTSNNIVGLYGDSHALAVSYQLAQELKVRNLKGVLLRPPSGCQVDPNVRIKGREGKNDYCSESFLSIVDYIKENVGITILLSRWTFRLYPIDGKVDSLTFNNGEGGSESENLRQYGVIMDDGTLDYSGEKKSFSLKGMVSAFVKTGTSVILMYPIPEVGWNIYRENYLHYSTQKNPLSNLSIDYSLYKKRNAFVTEIFDEIQDASNLYKVRPDSVFCNTFLENRCAAQLGGIPFYLDDDHLSDQGTSLLLNELIPILTQKFSNQDKFAYSNIGTPRN